MEAAPQQPEALEHTFTVLLVEDEVLIRLDVAEELRRAGWKVIEAGWKVIEVATADNAIDILNSPVIVVLGVTDVNMPGQANGLDLARFFDRERSDIKIVIMSGHFMPAAEPEQAPPCDLFIPKPLLHSQVVDQLMPLLRATEFVGKPIGTTVLPAFAVKTALS